MLIFTVMLGTLKCFHFKKFLVFSEERLSSNFWYVLEDQSKLGFLLNVVARNTSHHCEFKNIYSARQAYACLDHII